VLCTSPSPGQAATNQALLKVKIFPKCVPIKIYYQKLFPVCWSLMLRYQLIKMGQAVLEQRCLIPDPLADLTFNHACNKHSCLFVRGVSDEEKPVLN
jgi:hypothetical protein